MSYFPYITDDADHFASPFNAMLSAARAAGSVLKKRFSAGDAKIFQKARFDPVTEADLEAEAIIISVLSDAYPEIGFFSEESGMTHDPDATTRWMIDPLDGTRNFSRGIDCYATLIALQTKNKEGAFTTVAGIIYIPETGVTYYAEQNRGAVRVSYEGMQTLLDITDSLKRPDHMISLSARDVMRPDITGILKTSAFKFRDFGCTGLALAMIAEGKADGLISYSVNPWDICAGGLIIREAGGRACVPNGTNDPITGNRFIAGTPHTYKVLYEKIGL